jgi:hypothetical protein
MEINILFLITFSISLFVYLYYNSGLITKFSIITFNIITLFIIASQNITYFLNSNDFNNITDIVNGLNPATTYKVIFKIIGVSAFLIKAEYALVMFWSTMMVLFVTLLSKTLIMRESQITYIISIFFAVSTLIFFSSGMFGLFQFLDNNWIATGHLLAQTSASISFYLYIISEKKRYLILSLLSHPFSLLLLFINILLNRNNFSLLRLLVSILFILPVGLSFELIYTIYIGFTSYQFDEFAFGISSNNLFLPVILTLMLYLFSITFNKNWSISNLDILALNVFILSAVTEFISTGLSYRLFFTLYLISPYFVFLSIINIHCSILRINENFNYNRSKR